jgi:CDP-6-deoxy-D-xylo-4-hexulose-3-dehydrase
MILELASDSWGQDELDAIQRVVASGRFTMGEEVKRFETAFAEKFARRHAVMVNSGSSANLIAVAALAHRGERPLQPGDEVIVPAISWATTYHPLQQYGLRLRFVDVDLHTLNMDVEQLEAGLTPRTRMVVAVSVLGNPAPLDRIREFCERHGLILFEDNCESMGASLNSQLTGSFGDVSTFSTFFSHHISTMEGGLLTTDDAEIAHLARSLRSHGWVRDIPPDSGLYQPRQDEFDEAYRFILPGYNVRPMEMSAAIGSEQLKKFDRAIGIRRRNAELFVQLFQDDERFIIQRENGTSSWFSFTLILHPELTLQRSTVFDALREAGIGFRMITGGCFPRHDVIKYFDYDIVNNLDNADLAHDRGFFVGNHPRDVRPGIEQLRVILDRVAG